MRKKELLTRIAHKTGKKRDDVRMNHCGGTDCRNERNYDKRGEYLYKRIRQLRYKKTCK